MLACMKDSSLENFKVFFVFVCAAVTVHKYTVNCRHSWSEQPALHVTVYTYFSSLLILVSPSLLLRGVLSVDKSRAEEVLEQFCHNNETLLQTMKVFVDMFTLYIQSCRHFTVRYFNSGHMFCFFFKSLLKFLCLNLLRRTLWRSFNVSNVKFQKFNFCSQCCFFF